VPLAAERFGAFHCSALACVHVFAAYIYRHEPVTARDEVVIHAPRLASESLKRGEQEICRNRDLVEKPPVFTMFAHDFHKSL
jgi:hypothetical protein